jgi:uncharacterized protein
MQRHSLKDASFEALLRLADTYGSDVPENVTRDELEELVAEAIDEWKLEHREQNAHSVRVEETKYDIQLEMAVARETEEEIELPDSYNETRVVLMLRDPSWAFAYWDLKKADRVRFDRSEEFDGLMLRVFSLDTAQAPVRSSRSQFEIPVTLMDSRWYFNLPDQQTFYRLALVASESGKEETLALSNVIIVPRGMVADEFAGEEEGRQTEEILAHTGIQQLDVVTSGRRIPQRILDLIDDELLFN